MGQVSPHSRRLGLAFGSETVNQVGRSLRERLEGELAGELHDAGIAIAGDLAEGARGRAGAHRLHIGVVGCVERLHAELEVQPFIDAEVAEEAQVQNVESRPFAGTALDDFLRMPRWVRTRTSATSGADEPGTGLR